VHVVQLETISSGWLALPEPGVERALFRFEIFICPIGLIVENCLDPVSLLMHLPKDRRSLFGEGGNIDVKSGVMLDKSLLEDIDAAIAECGDSMIDL
jgi:hypothetical protein